MTYTLDDCLDFGVHECDTVRQVIDSDPDYIERALNTIHGFELDDEAMRHLARRYWHNRQWQRA